MHDLNFLFIYFIIKIIVRDTSFCSTTASATPGDLAWFESTDTHRALYYKGLMKPTPGDQYTTLEGDTLESISASAYGVPSKWPLIANVNKSQITLTSTAQIPTGTAVLIPVDRELAGLRQAQLARGLA